MQVRNESYDIVEFLNSVLKERYRANKIVASLQKKIGEIITSRIYERYKNRSIPFDGKRYELYGFTIDFCNESYSAENDLFNIHELTAYVSTVWFCVSELTKEQLKEKSKLKTIYKRNGYLIPENNNIIYKRYDCIINVNKFLFDEINFDFVKKLIEQSKSK